MQNSIANGLAAAATQPITVQVINQGPGIWGNVATGLITAGAAIGAVFLTHIFTVWRENQAAEKKLKQARQFIAIELVFLLEDFADSCSDVAADTGRDEDEDKDQDSEYLQHTYEPTVKLPELSFTDVSGDWQVLDVDLMYPIRELTVLQQEANRVISYVGNIFLDGKREEYFRERRYRYARLGLKAIIQVRRLRKMAGFPATRLDNGSELSVHRLLKEVWRAEHLRRTKEASKERKMLEDLNYPESMIL